MRNREKAIQWWDSTISDVKERVEWKFGLCLCYFGDRHYSSLTGREIEFIWSRENQNIETNKVVEK